MTLHAWNGLDLSDCNWGKRLSSSQLCIFDDFPDLPERFLANCASRSFEGSPSSIEHLD
jgi:hypothetical protein